MQDALPTDADRERWTAFGLWVQREVDRAQDSQGWSVQRIADEAKISRSGIYRWINVEGRRDPTPENVNKFCAALGIDPAEAYRILKWGRYADKPAPRAAPIPPAIEALLRKLQDPAVSDAEKQEVIRTVEWLARRPSGPPEPPAGRQRRAG